MLGLRAWKLKRTKNFRKDVKWRSSEVGLMAIPVRERERASWLGSVILADRSFRTMRERSDIRRLTVVLERDHCLKYNPKKSFGLKLPSKLLKEEAAWGWRSDTLIRRMAKHLIITHLFSVTNLLWTSKVWSMDARKVRTKTRSHEVWLLAVGLVSGK